MRRSVIKLLAAIAVIAVVPLAAGISRAQPFGAVIHGDLRLSVAWAAPTRDFKLETAAYLTITNTGQSPDRLLGGTAANARFVRIHRWISVEGLQKIRSLRDLAIDPGATVVMAPMVLNLAVMGLRDPLPEGQTLTLTLRFERAGDITLDLPVTSAPDSGSR